ncbi:hypothetical protein E5676_scaffold575G00120 [Cucumis melo var. makuwa]|uniref:Uncharacterized protein n=1 Tax=Cucumis melo var. makuwa TaxID=1194695 RepID=A0A5A7STE7_CUCMM|nr:hypothetical protein E6C27_scaffold708G00410 [Cucumis melo var. makuwa]TYK30348.1 hypothetical protein E5676_scaffold575G00120 [Cucumis melo var. makuwa]
MQTLFKGSSLLYITQSSTWTSQCEFLRDSRVKSFLGSGSSSSQREKKGKEEDHTLTLVAATPPLPQPAASSSSSRHARIIAASLSRSRGVSSHRLRRSIVRPSVSISYHTSSVASPSRSLSHAVAHRAPSIEVCEAQPHPHIHNPSRTHVPDPNSCALAFDPELNPRARIFFFTHDSSDSTGSSQPDCLSVSSGYATDQFVLGIPLGHRRLDLFIRDHMLHVFGNVSVLGYHFQDSNRRLTGRGRGKGKGKLASDQK